MSEEKSYEVEWTEWVEQDERQWWEYLDEGLRTNYVGHTMKYTIDEIIGDINMFVEDYKKEYDAKDIFSLSETLFHLDAAVFTLKQRARELECQENATD